jgi:hypothetical protein
MEAAFFGLSVLFLFITLRMYMKTSQILDIHEQAIEEIIDDLIDLEVELTKIKRD